MEALFALLSMAIAIIIAIALIRTRKMSAIWKGKYSEALVNRNLLELPNEYVVFSDLLFESNGYSTQIDHLVVSPYGVFVIETKGYKGWIFGGESSERWTQNIYGKKFPFYNPIKQNEGHVRFLRHLLKCDVEIPFIPIVVFNNEAQLKVLVKDHIVINRHSLTRVIMQNRNSVITNETIDWTVKTIIANSKVVDKEKKQKHDANVNVRKCRTARLLSSGVCPECGGSLVERCGKFGTFYGCSNYPKCKFTIK